MNRDAMVIYLRDVRDLEVARYRLQQLDEESERELQAKLAELERAGRHAKEPEEPANVRNLRITFEALIAVEICAVVLTALMLVVETPFFLAIGLFLLISGALLLMVVACLPTYLRERKKYQEGLTIVRAINRVAEVNAPDRERERREALAAREAARRAHGDELAKVESLLERYYALNVLPNQYRRLTCVCYIYDYMSSSKATLEDTLLHEHMENGFQRLEEKLDQVIAAVEEQVYETRCLRAENRDQAQRLATQNQLQLKLLANTERNAAEAAEYAELAACNTRAAALFAAADYFSN